jgi:hypothetical protein
VLTADRTRLAVLSMKYRPAAGSRPGQRAARTRRKCPLEKINTSSGIARTRGYYAIRAGGHMAGRFATRAAVAKELPPRTLLVDLGRAPSLIIAVVPFEQITIDNAHFPEAG